MLFIKVARRKTFMSLLSLTGDLIKVYLMRQLILWLLSVSSYFLSLFASSNVSLWYFVFNLIVWADKLELEILEAWLHEPLHIILFFVTMESVIECSVLLTVKHLFISTTMLVSIRKTSTVHHVPLSFLFTFFSTECSLFLGPSHCNLLKINSHRVLTRIEWLWTR